MIKRFLWAFMLLIALSAQAQTTTHPSPVGFVVGDSIIYIKGVQTQTEVKPGFAFVDRFKAFNKATKDKTIRYLWGGTSRQPLDTSRPQFYIDPGNSQVIDFALIRLQNKRDHRRLPNADLRKCEFQTLDLFFADLKLLPDDNFLVVPKKPLATGEYVLVQLSQQPVNEMGDLIVYPFTIDETPYNDFYKQNY